MNDLSPTPKVPVRKRLALFAVPLLACATVFATMPAAHADVAPNKDFKLGNAAEHYMGSQVAKHEGHGRDTGNQRFTTASVKGNDVSHWQGAINWKDVYAKGGRFSYAKATEGTTYRDPSFSDNYVGAYNAGLIHGAYHFGRPDGGSGAAQANYFADHGGAWSKDGKTLPGALDIEYAPSGNTCYGLSQASMRSWIADFLNTYHSRTGRWAPIYTTTDWWSTCTGNYSGFAANNPLWVARYSSSAGTLPAGWGFYTIWQYADSGTLPGDQDSFNGAYDRLQALANG